MSCRSFVNYWLIALFVLTIFFANKLTIRINLTNSMPHGIYYLKSTDALHDGDFVMVCLDNSLSNFALNKGYLHAGNCKNSSEPLIKEVAGQANDIVFVSANGIKINDYPLPHSIALNTDHLNRMLSAVPQGIYILKKNQLWLYGTESPRSWDSRYFGIINTSNIVSIAKPLLTWK